VLDRVRAIIIADLKAAKPCIFYEILSLMRKSV